MALTSDETRESLEKRLDKLRENLKYWQTWEADYEACKEEISEVDNEATAQQMVEIGAEYGSKILNEAEMRSITKLGEARPRTKAEVINILSGRSDTGRKNADYAQRQINQIEEQLDDLASASFNSQNDTEDAIMEITEELDEDGNVISSNVSNYNKEMDHLQDKLRDITNSKTAVKSATSTPQGSSKAVASSTESTSMPHRSPTLNKDSAPVVQKVDTQPGMNAKTRSSYAEAYENLHELNPIVATMDIEDDSESEEELESDEDDPEENQYGMTNIKDEISEDYVREMEALIRKHAMLNTGNERVAVNGQTEGASPSQPALTKQTPPISGLKSSLADSKNKRSVKFAEVLDIAPETKDTGKPDMRNTPDPEQNFANPMVDIIKERSNVQDITSSAGESKKVSRFKATKQPTATLSAKPLSKMEDGELDFKEELSLYNQRMNQQKVDAHRNLFQDELSDQPIGSTKVSKFKAARLGIPQDE